MKTYHQHSFSIKNWGGEGQFSGYASVFNVVDHHQEIVMPGAFQDSLKRWKKKGKLPLMLWQHNQHQPIGIWEEIREDSHGLYVRGRLLLDLQQGKEAYALMKSGVIDSLSIGFRPVKCGKTHKNSPKLLEEVDLMEISLVTFAANGQAKVTSVKGFEEEGNSSVKQTNGKILQRHDLSFMDEKPQETYQEKKDMPHLSHDERVQDVKESDVLCQQKSLINQMEEILQKSTERLEKMEVAFRRPGSIKDAVNARRNEGFRDFVCKGLTQGSLELTTKGMLSETNEQGGYLIPNSVVDIINRHLDLLCPLRKVARVTRIHTNRLDLVIDKSTSEAGWVSEKEARAETSMSDLLKLSIPVHEIYAKPLVSQRLLDDAAINVEEWLSQRIAEKMALVENKAFFFGDGNNQPKGIFTYDQVAAGKKETDKIQVHAGDMSSKDGADILIDAFYSLPAQYLAGACWIMSPQQAAIIRKLKEKGGGYLWQNSFSAGQPDTLLGYPVYLSDVLNENHKSQFLFGNFHEGYQIVDRQQMTMLRDPYSSKPYVEFYATKRVGGALVNSDAIQIIDITKSS